MILTRGFVYNLLCLLAFLLLLDITGDFLISAAFQSRGLHGFEDIIRLANYIVFGICLLLSGLVALESKQTWSFSSISILFAFIIIPIIGLVIGALLNNWHAVLREYVPYTAFGLVFLFRYLSDVQRTKLITFFVFLVLWMVGLKILISQLIHLVEYGNLSWKLWVKAAPLLMFVTIYFCSKILFDNKVDPRNFVFLAIVGFLVLCSTSRALLFLYAGVTFLTLWSANLKSKFLFVAALFSAVVMSVTFLGKGVGGYWDVIAGTTLEASFEHRADQIQILISRISDSYFFGVGFGYYTPSYDEYMNTPLPYLLELDLINFFSKIGNLFGTVYLLFSIWVFFLLPKRLIEKTDLTSAVILQRTMACLFVYSLVQTFHAGVLYWFFLAFFIASASSVRGN